MGLDVAEILVGKKSTTTHHLERSAIRGGGCSSATHFVREPYVGAFALGLEQNGKSRSAGSIFSGAGESERVNNYHDGQADKCEQLAGDARAASPW
jgi:hypothetical protein